MMCIQTKWYSRMMVKGMLLGLVVTCATINVQAAKKASTTTAATTAVKPTAVKTVSLTTTSTASTTTTATAAGAIPAWKRMLYTRAYQFVVGHKTGTKVTIPTVDGVTQGVAIPTDTYNQNKYNLGKNAALKANLGTLKGLITAAGGNKLNNLLNVMQQLGDANSKLLSSPGGAPKEITGKENVLGTVTFEGAGATQNIKVTAPNNDFYWVF